MHKNITACSGDDFSCRRKTEKKLPRWHVITRQFDAVGKRGHSRQFDYVIDKIASTLTSPSQPTQLQATPQQTPIFTFRQSIPRVCFYHALVHRNGRD